MRKILTTSAAVLLAFGATAAQAHDPAAQRADWLGERLELTDEQKAQVNEIFTEAQAQREALREQAREERKAAVEQRRARWQQVKSLNESTQERLSGVLTEEQNAQLSDMREGMKKRAIMRRGAQGRGWSRGMDRGRGMERRRDMARRMMRQRHKQQESENPAADE